MGTEAVKTEAEAWWEWISPTPRDFLPNSASDSQRKLHFNELVKRCVLVDSLSPSVTPAILTAAVGQFGTVLAVKFLTSPLRKNQPSGCAILEMEKQEQVAVVEAQMKDYMFMIGGMPRPARAVCAKAAMLVDHPFNRKKPSVEVRFVSKNDPDADVVFRKRRKVEQHALEALYLQQAQRKAEEELAKKHEENYQELKRKYTCIKDNKDLDQLRRAYGITNRES